MHVQLPIALFKKTYPNSRQLKEILLSSSLAGMAIYLFLIIFQPFGTYNFQTAYKYVLLSGYGIATALSFTLVSLGTIHISNWTLGKELLKVSLVFFICACFNYCYNSLFISKVALSWLNFGYMLLYTFSLFCPVTLIYLLLRFLALNQPAADVAAPQQVAMQSEILTEPLQPVAAPAPPVTERALTQVPVTEIAPIPPVAWQVHITAEPVVLLADGRNLEIRQEHFLFANALDNYCLIYITGNKGIEKHMVRMTLTNLEHFFTLPGIKRCHRSFLVNFNAGYTASGNSQGYKLCFDHPDAVAYVSRTYLNGVKMLIRLS